MDYRTFVMNLANLNRYKEDLSKVDLELEQIFYVLRGVKGVGYTDNGGSTNESQKALNWLSLDEKYNAKLKERDFICEAICQVESILERMPEDLSSALQEIYIKGKTFRRVGMDHGYSDHGYWQYLKRETERYL